MKSRDLFQAIGQINDDIITDYEERAEEVAASKSKNTITVTPEMSETKPITVKSGRLFSMQFAGLTAAVLVFVIGTVFMFNALSRGNELPVAPNDTSITNAQSQATQPQINAIINATQQTEKENQTTEKEVINIEPTVTAEPVVTNKTEKQKGSDNKTVESGKPKKTDKPVEATVKPPSKTEVKEKWEPKIYSNVTIDQNFCGETVLVTLDKRVGGVNKVHSKSFFGDFPIAEIQDLTGGFVNADNPEIFRQILAIKLPVYCKQNVIDVIKILEQVDGIICAEPSYIGSWD